MKGFGRHRNLMRPTRIELIKHYVSGAAPVSSLTCGWVSLPREQRMPREDTCKCCSIACRIHGAICCYYFSHSRCLHPGQITQRWMWSLHIIDLKRVTEDVEEEIHCKCDTSLRSGDGRLFLKPFILQGWGRRDCALITIRIPMVLLCWLGIIHGRNGHSSSVRVNVEMCWRSWTVFKTVQGLEEVWITNRFNYIWTARCCE